MSTKWFKRWYDEFIGGEYVPDDYLPTVEHIAKKAYFKGRHDEKAKTKNAKKKT